MVRIIIAILLAISFTGFEAFAGDKHGFAETSDEMVQGLTQPLPKQTMRTRSLKSNVQTRRIEVLSIKEEKEVKEQIVVVENEPVPSINLKVEFDYNSYIIRKESFAVLKELRIALNHEALLEKTIIIKGHTDSDGSDAYNLKLSLNRGLAVKNYLLGDFFINEDRLKVVGYGEAVPLVPNITPENKQLNRRVEIQAE